MSIVQLTTYVSLMSVFTTPVGTTDSVGATSDLFTRNAIACAGTGGLVGLGTASVLATLTAIPAQMLGAGTVCAGLIYVGNRKADGKPMNPFTKDEATESGKTDSATAAA